jgi:uncharacterized protein YjbI with pentapeptide repeats
MARNEGKDVQQVYDCLALDINDMDVRGRIFVRRVIEGYENLDLGSCVFYGCFPTQIENGICIKPETLPENLLLNDKDFSDLDLRGLKLDALPDEIRNVDFSGSDLSNAEFQDLEVYGSDFRRVKGYHIEMYDCEFNNCTFNGSDFSGSNLDFKAIGCNFSSCDFEHASLYGASFESCDLRSSTLSDGGNFQNCDLSYSVFRNLYDFPFVVDCTLYGATFEFEDNKIDDEDYISTPKILESVTIEGVLSHFDFSNTNLTGVSFANTSLKHINFEGADLDNVDFSNTKFESSVSFKNANLTDVDFRRCRGLENVDFEGATLNKVQYDDEDVRYFIHSDFSGKSLIGHDFSDEDMMGDIFTDADLEDADFRNSYLVGVDFENANLKNANFQGATLTRCNLKNTNLENANLEFTNLEWADMKGSDVSFADFTLAKYNSGTILPDSITQNQIESMALTDAHKPRENSRGISVDFERVSNLVDDILDYIWNNWNDLDHSEHTIILEGYETQFVNAQNELVTIPIVIEMTEDETHAGASYDPETGIVYVYLETESLPRFVQILNPNQNHPRSREFRNYLIAALVHEITHALDAKEEIRRKRNKYTPSDFSSRYYNTPIEVNAFANQIIAEILMSGETYMTVEDALNSSETWQEEKNTWSTKSKRTIMKRVYSRLFEN